MAACLALLVILTWLYEQAVDPHPVLLIAGGVCELALFCLAVRAIISLIRWAIRNYVSYQFLAPISAISKEELTDLAPRDREERRNQRVQTIVQFISGVGLMLSHTRQRAAMSQGGTSTDRQEGINYRKFRQFG
ncbi:hypothetical protein [Nonomuraea sp. NPDC023979]|uniref:hypothetical protein n=1 Tax=Nonomuraea sp. NPDC023979 TaxID=3154796 RepID=UPI0033DFF226